LQILHISNGRRFGGIEQMLVTMARSRQSASLESEFAVCAPGRFSDELNGTGVPVLSLGDVRLRRPGSLWAARRILRDRLRSKRPDALICHAPWSFAIFASVGRREGLPVIWWQHDRATGREFIERWARTTRADLVVANSYWTAESARAVQPDAPVRVLYCPVALDESGAVASRSVVRRRLGTGLAETVILIASRLERWKGHMTLLQALSRMTDLEAWKLWVAGGAQRPSEQTYLTQLHREATRLGLRSRVRFLGERRDVPSVMAAADVFCQPNDAPEPFGIVLAEALLSGLPVVTAAMGGARELIDQTCGRLVAARDPVALAHALRELVCDPALRARLGRAGQVQAAARCSPGVVLPQLAHAISACCLAPAA
jgi:glycosyltransferase involved in cell wall biosynthesis